MADVDKVLILGGTTEAVEIAARLSLRTDIITISSLAGRVKRPSVPKGIIRVGGFGGVSGLTSYLAEEKITAVVDATHPFAAKISRNAETACNILHISLVALNRLPWAKTEGDCWHNVSDMQEAASYIAQKGGRVFLTIGRQELSSFIDCKNAWFLIRSIDEPQEELPQRSKLILQRGPFDLEHEMQLLRDHAINYLVSKNSGGMATYSKIKAARALGIPVVMVSRPIKHTVSTVEHVDEVLAELSRLLIRQRTAQIEY